MATSHEKLPEIHLKVAGGKFRFSLRTLFVATFLAGVLFAFGFWGLCAAALALMTGYFFLNKQNAAATGCVVAFVVLSCSGAGTSVEVRLNTGDQRLRFWGVPILHSTE